jgi:hypothetical protein
MKTLRGMNREELTGYFNNLAEAVESVLPMGLGS